MFHNCALSTFTCDNFNNLIVKLKNEKKIIRITTNDKPNDYKYMLIKDCIPLSDAEGDLPYYALSGADLVYQYNYGTFYPYQEKYLDVLSEEDVKFFNDKFHFCSPVVFGERVKNITVYNSQDEIDKIEDFKEMQFITMLFNDIQTYNWQPIMNDLI